MPAVVLAAVTGCGSLFGDDSPEPVRLRVQNQSVVTFDAVTLATLDGFKTWYAVEAGETTPYTAVSAAYGIASTDVVIGTDTLRLQVIDYVGEDYLEGGDYTFLLNVSGPYGDYPSLTQALRRDQ